MIGGNFRLDALQCALLRVKLPHLPAYCAARRRNAEYYKRTARVPARMVPAVPGVAAPAEARLVLPVTGAGNDHIWNQYTLRVPGPGRRDALQRHSRRPGHRVRNLLFPFPCTSRPVRPLALRPACPWPSSSSRR